MRTASHYITAPLRLALSVQAGGLVRAEVSTAGIYNLASPVVLVTKGKGREVFKNSRQLIQRIEQIGEIGEEIIQINNNVSAVPPEGIAALNTMLSVCGLRRFRLAAKRSGNPARAPYTRFEWAFLSLYLGWEWRALR